MREIQHDERDEAAPLSRLRFRAYTGACLSPLLLTFGIKYSSPYDLNNARTFAGAHSTRGCGLSLSRIVRMKIQICNTEFFRATSVSRRSIFFFLGFDDLV